jgi:hypothetical protein
MEAGSQKNYQLWFISKPYGFLRLLLPPPLLLLLGGGFGCSLIFGCSFGGRLSLPFCPNAIWAGATIQSIAAINITVRIRVTAFITNLPPPSLFTPEGEAGSRAAMLFSKLGAKHASFDASWPLKVYQPARD